MKSDLFDVKEIDLLIQAMSALREETQKLSAEWFICALATGKSEEALRIRNKYEQKNEAIVMLEAKLMQIKRETVESGE